MTREEKLQKAHQMFDNRNLLTELKWQREYFKRGYISNREELFNIWIFDECIKALEQEPKTGRWKKIKSGNKTFPESIVCSRCGGENSYISQWDRNNNPLSKTFRTTMYCPNCGARMREDGESE